eukprot:s2072_g4.t1
MLLNNVMQHYSGWVSAMKVLTAHTAKKRPIAAHVLDLPVARRSHAKQPPFHNVAAEPQKLVGLIEAVQEFNGLCPAIEAQEDVIHKEEKPNGVKAWCVSLALPIVEQRPKRMVQGACKQACGVGASLRGAIGGLWGEGRQEGCHAGVAKVVKGSFDVKFEIKRLLVGYFAEGQHGVGCKDGLYRLASRDRSDLGDDGWPMGKKAKHEDGSIKFLKGFQEKNRANLGSSCHRRCFWDQSRNAYQKVPCQENVVQESEQQSFTLRRVPQADQELDVPGQGGTLKGILGVIPYAAQLLEGSGVLELAAGQPVLTGTGQRGQGRPGGRRRRGCQLMLEAGRINAPFARRAFLGVGWPMAGEGQGGFPGDHLGSRLASPWTTMGRPVGKTAWGVLRREAGEFK